MALEDQMEMNFGNVPDNTIGVDPVSGNEIPLGSNAENVRDDIPANLSEGEIVIPADVVNFHGVKLFEDLRAEAKMGYAQMAQDGRMGGEPMMDEDMDIEITIEDLDVMDDEEPVAMSKGGMNAVEPGKLRNTRRSVNSGAQAAARSMSKAGIRNMSGSGSKNSLAAHKAAMKAHNDRRRAKKRNLAAAQQAAAQAAPTNVAAAQTTPTNVAAAQSQNNTSSGNYLVQQQKLKDQALAQGNTSNVVDGQYDIALRTNPDAENRFGEYVVPVYEDAVESISNVGSAIKNYLFPPGVKTNPGAFTMHRNRNGVNFLGGELPPGYGTNKNEGGLINPEPFYSQKGGFDLSSVNTVVVEYMNDEGHRIFITFVDGVPQMEIPEGYYPAGDAVSIDDVVNYTIPTMDGISSEPVQSSSSKRDKPSTPAPTPINYKELSLEELKAMIADQRTMGSKIFAGLSPITKLIMWDKTRRTKAEIERRIADPATSEVDKMRLNSLLELINREEPGLVKTLLDKVQGKEFERIVSQIPTPVRPDVDYSDPTLAPNQNIAQPYTPDPQESSQMQLTGFEGMGPSPDEGQPITTPGVDAEIPGVPLTRAQIEAAKQIAKEAAANAFSKPEEEPEPQPAPQTQVQQMRTTQQDNKENKKQKAKDRSKAFSLASKKTGDSIAKIGRTVAPSNEKTNIDYGDPRRGGAPSTRTTGGGGRNKGGLASKKSKKKKSK